MRHVEYEKVARTGSRAEPEHIDVLRPSNSKALLALNAIDGPLLVTKEFVSELEVFSATEEGTLLGFNLQKAAQARVLAFSLPTNTKELDWRYGRDYGKLESSTRRGGFF